MTTSRDAAGAEDRTRLLVETVYKEFQRVQAKSAATDDWFFRFLSIAVVPFLVFLAYSLVTPSFRIFVAALPLLSLIGLLVVGVLTSHYLYANAYGAHLQRRLNLLLGPDTMTDLHYGPAAYGGFTPVTVSFLFGLLLLLLLNVCTIPLIDREIHLFHGRNAMHLNGAEILLEWYWQITATATGVVVAAAASAFWATYRRLQKLDTKEAELNQALVSHRVPLHGEAEPKKQSARGLALLAIVFAVWYWLKGTEE
jgi:hypothetical protein